MHPPAPPPSPCRVHAPRHTRLGCRNSARREGPGPDTLPTHCYCCLPPTTHPATVRQGSPLPAATCAAPLRRRQTAATRSRLSIRLHAAAHSRDPAAGQAQGGGSLQLGWDARGRQRGSCRCWRCSGAAPLRRRRCGPSCGRCQRAAGKRRQRGQAAGCIWPCVQLGIAWCWLSCQGGTGHDPWDTRGAQVACQAGIRSSTALNCLLPHS